MITLIKGCFSKLGVKFPGKLNLVNKHFIIEVRE